MPNDLMTLRDLRVQTFKERREGRLTTLPPNFYKRVKTLEMKIKEIITNSKEDPKKFDKANSDIRKFLDMKLELHKHRERKLTDLAREKINGQNPNTTNVHKNEIEYLTSLCEVIEVHRKKTLMGEINNGIKLAKTFNKPSENIKKKPVIKEESKKDESLVNEEYIKVEILEDLPTFIGMDAKNYTLKNKSIEVIPIYNAKILSDAGKVKIIKEVKA